MFVEVLSWCVTVIIMAIFLTILQTAWERLWKKASQAVIVDQYYLIQQWGKQPSMPDGMEFYCWRNALYNGKLARFNDFLQAEFAIGCPQYRGETCRIVKVTEELISEGRKSRGVDRAEHTHRDDHVQAGLSSYRP